MSLGSRIAKLEKVVNDVVGTEPASMVADPRFWNAVWGALPEKELEAFTARWPEFGRLFEPPDPNQVDPIEEAIQAVGRAPGG